MVRMPRFLLVLSALFVLGCQDTLVEPVGDAAFAQGGNGKGKGGGGGGEDPVDPSYSILDLGVGVALDITNTGIIAGSLDGQSVLWSTTGTSVSQPEPSPGIGDLSEAGLFAVGNDWDPDTRTAFRWTLDGTTVVGTTVLPSLVGALYAQVSAVNDVGQAAGDNFHDDVEKTRTAILWNADGTIIALPHLPGSNRAWGRAMNNSGHVVGKSFFDFPETWPHAVLWIDTGAGYTVVDLTPDVDNTGDSHATWVSEPSGGLITIAGRAAESAGSGATFWTVDVATGKVVDVVRFADKAEASDVNAGGDVIWRDLVWNWLGGPTSTLPVLNSRQCGNSVQGRSINDAGTVVGQSAIPSKGRCRSHAVIWTRIDP